MRHRVGFTLIELLVVISIIALLISIMLPSLRAAKETARDVQCRSQMHQIGLAIMVLGDDNRGHLPGIWGPPWTGAQPLEGSYMGKEVLKSYYQPAPVAAQTGTLVSYLGGEGAARAIYRCPSLVTSTFRSGIGSNGMFDVTMFQALPGASVVKLPQFAEYVAPVTNQNMRTPLPVIIEEDPAHGINKDFVDMGHTSINRFAVTHFGNGGNYVSVDGSGHRLQFEGGLGPQGYAWTLQFQGLSRQMGIALPYGTLR